MNRVLEEIRALVASIVEAEQLTLVDVVLRGKTNSHVLEIFIESEYGISPETCARVSRQLSGMLDRTNILRGAYTLVVSSPGLDRPLKLPVQFKRNVGKTLEVIFNDGTMDKTIRGTLLSCTETGIELQNGSERYAVPFNAIIRATVKLPW